MATIPGPTDSAAIPNIAAKHPTIDYSERRDMRLIIVSTLAGMILAGCNQQTEADLAVCKSDLTKSQSEAAAAKAAQATADQKAIALQQEIASLSAQVTQLQRAPALASAEAAKAEVAPERKFVRPATKKPVTVAQPAAANPPPPSNQPPAAPLTPEERRRSKF